MPSAVARAVSQLSPALRSLADRTRLLKSRTSDDARLAGRLREGVEASALRVAGLAFYVHDGVVSIYGGVANGADREAVIDVVVEQKGVQRVIDHLRIGDA